MQHMVFLLKLSKAVLTSRSSSFGALRLTGQFKPALLRSIAPVCPAA